MSLPFNILSLVRLSIRPLELTMSIELPQFPISFIFIPVFIDYAALSIAFIVVKLSIIYFTISKCIFSLAKLCSVQDLSFIMVSIGVTFFPIAMRHTFRPFPFVIIAGILILKDSLALCIQIIDLSGIEATRTVYKHSIFWLIILDMPLEDLPIQKVDDNILVNGCIQIGTLSKDVFSLFALVLYLFPFYLIFFYVHQHPL